MNGIRTMILAGIVAVTAHAGTLLTGYGIAQAGTLGDGGLRLLLWSVADPVSIDMEIYGAGTGQRYIGCSPCSIDEANSQGVGIAYIGSASSQYFHVSLLSNGGGNDLTGALTLYVSRFDSSVLASIPIETFFVSSVTPFNLPGDSETDFRFSDSPAATAGGVPEPATWLPIGVCLCLAVPYAAIWGSKGRRSAASLGKARLAKKR